jgi:DNA-binding NtrC family response regulator
MQIAEIGLGSDGAQPTRDDESRVIPAVKERLIGVSRWATTARAALAAHAAHDSPIIIQGEPGTGKEFLARFIHESSARCQGPFVTISCESVSEESIEAALFGWIRVLPSGHNRTQRGLVESAAGGTLYINGFSTFSSALKVKLARLIQYQEFRRLGDDILETADVRLSLGSTPISRSGAEEEMELDGTVIAVSEILSIPPLRRRRVDIEPLARHFIKQFCRQFGKEQREIAADTIALLRRYDWPGNVSELKRVIEQMIQRSAPPCLEPSLLPASLAQSSNPATGPLPPAGVNLAEETERFQRALICAALKQCSGVQAKAARVLGLKLTTLNTKIARYGINVALFK